MSDDRPKADLDEEELGGETPCWAHLLDDEGRLPGPAQTAGGPASTPADTQATETHQRG
ncbi:MAG: hypothetical protein IT307_11230 [Chloroflexi bacterium]|nr:hypothetical protein [Chloroflexota bacterium]